MRAILTSADVTTGRTEGHKGLVVQEMDSHCAKMVDLLSTQAGSSPPPAAQSNPVVHGQGQAGHGHPPIPQPQASLPAVPALVKGPSGEVKGSLERVMVVEPSAAAAAKGLSTEAKGSTARLPSTEHPVRRDGLASLVAPALGNFPNQLPACLLHHVCVSS